MKVLVYMSGGGGVTQSGDTRPPCTLPRTMVQSDEIGLHAQHQTARQAVAPPEWQTRLFQWNEPNFVTRFVECQCALVGASLVSFRLPLQPFDRVQVSQSVK